jgi:hypothetical protein
MELCRIADIGTEGGLSVVGFVKTSGFQLTTYIGIQHHVS